MNHSSIDNMRNASPVQQHQKPHTPEKDSKLAASTTNGHLQANGLSRMSNYPLEVKLEAVDRIQTQVNLNRAQLENCTREMTKIAATLDTISIHYNTLLERMTQWEEYVQQRQKDFLALTQEVERVRSSAPAAQTGERMDDKTLEILSNNLATVSSKANEVDNLKIMVELLKRRLARMEEQGGFAPPPGQRDSLHQQISQPPQASPPTISHPQQETRAPTSYHAPPPEARHPHPEAEAAAANWAAANQTKRPHVNGVEAAHPGGDSPSKRPRLAPLEPRRPHESQRYDPARQEAEERYRRQESEQSYAEHANQAHHQQYEEDPAYRGGPPGSAGRGGRPRKYPVQDHAWATPAKVDSGRQVMMDGHVMTQMPDGQWFAVTADSSRRSSVQGQPPNGPALSPGAQHSPSLAPGQILSQVPRDPYAHTKKTRTKPIRNSEGVLIRKDGRPDMRSQSSAANLRKVHARKEEERRLEAQQRQRGHSSQIGDRGDGGSEMAGDDHSVASTPQHFSGQRRHHTGTDYEGDDDDDRRRAGSPSGPDDSHGERSAERGMYAHGGDEQRSSVGSDPDDRSSPRSVSSHSLPREKEPQHKQPETETKKESIEAEAVVA
jgi:hypothetical protein